MPFQALRFVHAASLLVDHQLHDVGPVDDEMKPALIDATVSAFERLVEICVDQEVDFLLLTGDTFCESDRSLRARVALREGFDCLRDADIEVFVVPGPHDPPSAWHEFAALPDNVSLFVPATDEPTAVMSDGNVIATIQACSRRNGMPTRPTDAESPPHSPRTNPLRISIVPPFESQGTTPSRSTVEALLRGQSADYLAVPLPYSRLTAIHGGQMAHCPGPATSISQRDQGLCGCTLVTVDEHASISARHLTTSPVRHERIEIAVTEDTSWDELIATMRERIESLEQLDAASVVLLDWHFTGTGELLSSLVDEEAEAELFELLAVDATTLADVSVSHRLRISPMSDAQAEAAWRDQTQSEADGEQASPFVTGLFSRLDEAGSIAHDVVEAVRAKNDSDSPWIGRLEEIVSRVSPTAVVAHARRHGMAWFRKNLPDSTGIDRTSDDELPENPDESAETAKTVAASVGPRIAPPDRTIADEYHHEEAADEDDFEEEGGEVMDGYDDDGDDEYEAA